jgi:hypothetical protein
VVQFASREDYANVSRAAHESGDRSELWPWRWSLYDQQGDLLDFMGHIASREQLISTMQSKRDVTHLSLWLEVSGDGESDSIASLRAAVERFSEAFREGRSPHEADMVLVIHVVIDEKRNRTKATGATELGVQTSRPVEHGKWPTTQEASETQSP